MMPNPFRRVAAIVAVLSFPLASGEADARSRYCQHHPCPPAFTVPKTDAALDQPSAPVTGMEAESRFCQNHPCPPSIFPPNVFAEMESSLAEATKPTQADREFARFVREMDRTGATIFKDGAP